MSDIKKTQQPQAQPQPNVQPQAAPGQQDRTTTVPRQDQSVPAPRLDAATKTRLDERARILKALAHPTRLFILDRLAAREHCVCELTDMIGADISTVSKHLSLLKNAGIIASDKRGNQVWYFLRTPCVMNFFGCVESVLAQGRIAAAPLQS